MKIPFWKKWLSYLVELHVESAPSEHNPHLYVSLVKGRYQLSSANAVYSYADLYANFRTAFARLQFDLLPGNHVLLLGYGLGSIPHLLEITFGKKFDYTAVEIDASVLYLANKYTLPALQSRIDFVETDAAAFVHFCAEKYDLICMDVFADNVVPVECQTPQYVRALRDLLTPDGVLLFNRLTLAEEDKDDTRTFYREVFRPVFPDAGYVDAGGNWILVNVTKADNRLVASVEKSCFRFLSE